MAFLTGCGGTVAAPAPDVHETTSTDAGASKGEDASVARADASPHVGAADASLADGALDDADADEQADAHCTPIGSPDLTLTDLDTPCYGGATARELLAVIPPTFASTFDPGGPPAGVTWTGSLTPSALAMTFAYAGGAITCAAPRVDCDPPNSSYQCPQCVTQPGTISVEIAVTFQTADGAFNEQFSALATYEGVAQGAWSASLPGTQLHGSRPPMFGSDETLDFEGDFGPYPAVYGFVTEESSHGDGGGGKWLQ